MSGFLKFRQLFQKNKSYLILIGLPIAFTLLFGGAMSPIFIDKIPTGIFDLDHSPSSKTVIDQFYDSPSMEMVEGFDSLKQVEEAIIREDIRGCVVIPEGFGGKLKKKESAQVLVIIDGSNLLIGNNLQLYATTILTSINASVQMQTLETGNMMPYQAEQSVYTLNLADRTLYNPQLGYFYYLYAGLLAVFVQQTFLAVTVPVLVTEKNRMKMLRADRRIRKLQAMKMSQLVVRYGLLSMVSMLACFLIVQRYFKFPLRGSIGMALLLHGIFIACLVGVAFVLSSIFDDVTHGVQVVMFFTIPTMLSCGYSWPEYMMPPGFASVMKAVWPLYYYANPLRDIMLKGVGYVVIKPYIIGGSLFAMFWIPVGILLYKHKIRAIRNLEVYERASLE